MVHRTLCASWGTSQWHPHPGADPVEREDGLGTVIQTTKMNMKMRWQTRRKRRLRQPSIGTKPHRRPFPAASSIAMGWAMARHATRMTPFGWPQMRNPLEMDIGFRSVARSSLTIGEMRAISPDGKIIGVKKAVSVDEMGRDETVHPATVIFWVPSMQWSMSLNGMTDGWPVHVDVGINWDRPRWVQMAASAYLSAMEMTVLEMNGNGPHWPWSPTQVLRC